MVPTTWTLIQTKGRRKVQARRKARRLLSIGNRKNTAERCVGVVKARLLQEKNTAQHLTEVLLKPVFFETALNKPNEIEFIRVDGVTTRALPTAKYNIGG